MKLNSIFFVVVFGIANVDVAHAQEIPRYDVPSHCRKVAEFGGTYSAQMEQSCFEIEQNSYDTLKPIWNDLPESMKTHCDQVARFGGEGSYQML